MKKFMCFMLAIAMIIGSVVMVNAGEVINVDDRFGNNVNVISYTVGNEYTVHDEVKYVFAGWSENIDDIDAITTNFQSDKTYYAVWKKDGKVVVTNNMDFSSFPMHMPVIPTGSGITWNPIENKVSLDGSVIDVYSRTAVIGMLFPSNAKIILTGDNYLTINNPKANIEDSVSAISGFDDLEIEGTGSLSINASACQESHYYPIGICANSLQITGGKLNVVSENYGNSSSQWAYGIKMGGDLLVSGRDTELKVDTINIGDEDAAYGIYLNSGSLKINESTVSINTSGSALWNSSEANDENWIISTDVAIQLYDGHYSYNGNQTSGALKFGSVYSRLSHGIDSLYAKYDEVCYIDGNPSVFYPSINTAMLVAEDGVETKVVLVKDTVENIYNFENKKIELDLNGHVVSALGDQEVLYACGDLTITDSNKDVTHYYEVKSNGLWTLTDSAIGSIPYESLTARPNEGSIIAVKGGAITGGKGSHAINALSGGILTISGASIIGNQGDSALRSVGVINILSGIIAGNVGGYNGTISVDFNKNVNFYDGEVSFNNAYNGGAFNSSSGRVDMFGGKVLYNYASNQGGAVYNGILSTSFHMHGGEIKYNEAANEGGGIYDSQSDISFEGLCIVTDNTSNGKTSNVYEKGTFGINNGADNVQTSLSAGSIIGVTISSGHGQFTKDGQGLSSEASLFVSDNEKYGILFDTDHLVLGILPACRIGSTTYESIELALGADHIGEGLDNPTEIVLLRNVTENVTIPANRHITLDLNGKILKNTGIVDIINTQSTITIYENAVLTLTDSSIGGTITGNTKGKNGGAVDIRYGATFNMQGGTISGNKVSSVGGGVYNVGAFNMSGGTITGNSAKIGGGVYNEGKFYMSGGTITGNKATNGGVYFGNAAFGRYESVMTVAGIAKIIGNTNSDGTTASNIYLIANKKINIGIDQKHLENGAIIGVTTETAPTLDTPVVITGTNTEDYNKYFSSDNDDYAVIFNEDHLELIEGKIQAITDEHVGYYTTINDALTYGGLDQSGAPYTWTSTSQTSIKLLGDITEDVTIPEGRNIILDLNGKVLRGTGSTSVINNSGNLTVTDSAIKANNPHYFEYHKNSAWTLTTTAISSAPTPGAIDFDTIKNLDIVKIEGSVITGGTGFPTHEGHPDCGGAIYNNECGNISVNNITIIGDGNRYGGGIYNESEEKCTIRECSIVGNRVSDNGGGIFNRGTLDMIECSIIGNVAAAGGGVVNTGTLNVKNCIIKNNSSSEFAGGVINYGSLDISDTVIIKDNTVDTTVSNLCLFPPTYITLAVLSQNTQIGLTLYDEVGASTIGAISETGSSYIDCFHSDNDSFIVVASDGALYLQKRSIVLTADSASKYYDGTALTKDAFVISKGAIRNNDELIVTVSGTITDSGEVNNEITSVVVSRGGVDVSDEYLITTESGILHVSPFALNVIGTQVSDKEYDGTTVASVSIGITSGAVSGDDVTVVVSSAAFTDNSVGDNKAVSVTYKLNGSSAANYTAPSGETLYASINPKEIVITSASVSKKYDGLPLADNTYTKSIELPQGEILTVTVSGIITNAGEIVNDITDWRIVKDQEDITGFYKFTTVGGILRVDKRTVVITSASISKVYDEQPLTSNEFEVGGDGFVDGEATITATGSQTEVGSSKNTIVITGTYNPDNYDITKNEGTITITAKTQPQPVKPRPRRDPEPEVKEEEPEVKEDEPGFKTCPQDETCVYAPFPDANTKAWYHDGVHFCVENKYMNGYTNGLFGPDDTLSRAMVVQILYNLEGRPAVEEATTYTDVQSDKWYANAIAWAEDHNIVEGYGNCKFGPEDPVTREQLAAIYYRYSSYKGYSVTACAELTAFTDASLVSNWALKSIKWATAVKLMQGNGNGILDPRSNATRAQAATMLKNYCENIAK